MKILWINPSFLDYRVPVYQKLNQLTEGNFYILYSIKRVPKRINIKIKAAIGENAIGFEGESVFEFGKNEMANKHLRIPYTYGLYKQITTVNADIIITEGFFQWTPQALRYAIRHHKPIFIDYERTEWTERECPQWRTLYRKIVDRFITGYLVNGSLTKEYLESIGVKKNKIYIAGMSADSTGLANAVNNYLHYTNSTKSPGLIYCYSGQMIPRKGVDYLLKAWLKHIKQHPQDLLMLVGGGELLERFQKEYGSVNSIQIKGSVDYDEIYKYYAISNVFVIPTLEDNWSLVVPEAMACSLPIACSIYNGCYPELVHEGENGVLFNPLDEQSLLRALDIFHRVDLSAYGQKSKEIEAKYNSDIVANNILKACELSLK